MAVDTHTRRPKSLLDELDARQNEVIRQLDELNAQIEDTLKLWTEQSADAEL
jgi:hypothetical protein